MSSSSGDPSSSPWTRLGTKIFMYKMAQAGWKGAQFHRPTCGCMRRGLHDVAACMPPDIASFLPPRNCPLFAPHNCSLFAPAIAVAAGLETVAAAAAAATAAARQATPAALATTAKGLS
eukprot:277495-Chlamydomonas_euryale.AAC.1